MIIMIYRCPTCNTKDGLIENLKDCQNKRHYIGMVGHKTRHIHINDSDSKNLDEVIYNIPSNMDIERTYSRYIIPADAILDGK